jgi:hypothetical protein
MSEKIRDIEKNDVDISELFKWTKEVEIEDAFSGVKVKFYMRLLGDADLGRARTHGYRKSSELRKKLKTKDSDERTSLIAELEDFTDPEIVIKAIDVLRTPDIYQRAIKNVDIPEPKEPSDDELEKWEEYQKAVDDYSAKFKEAVDKEAEKLRLEDEKYLKERVENELYKIYENEVINRLCQEEMNNTFYDMSIYLATFKDDKFKVLAFKNFDVYNNIRPALKTRLKEEYQKLELGIDVLKKSPEATD